MRLRQLKLDTIKHLHLSTIALTRALYNARVVNVSFFKQMFGWEVVLFHPIIQNVFVFSPVPLHRFLNKEGKLVLF